ncbi:Uma2 family endonuclease [Streptomyces sp. WI04-05B]|uniref:Uma2 family endonuclease n=1 Tax=Streptomyces TaxID=1883 RepID=UPI0029AC77A2|nr:MULTISPECIES: Uma2 family endonuclease [unclassified Streptomyces]MDX2543984.1 Uma2 family endonuclease [Streptomyces sp. WI04-05B]MDX2584306.1 Uma2 family endonuclease [Streptomyces sp. WI04-05A]MDX3753134.1 Uma2 family endonuclease [Streptomyces sp. AK08-02]
MSAVSEDEVAGEPPYRWPIPPAEGWTADDLDRIPGLPPHTELIDGSLVFMSPQTAFHGRCMRLLENSLLEQAPDHLDVMREMAVRLDLKNRPEPDVLVFSAEANTGPRQTWYKPEDILLAVEVVSDDSRERDREVKPRKYAAAGVSHFWRVEEDGDKGLPVVYVYELDPATTTYGLTGIFHARLKVPVPFDIDIDLTSINSRRPRS